MCRAPEVTEHLTTAVKRAPTSRENAKSALVCVLGMGFFLATDTLSKVAVTVLGMPVLQMLTLRGLGMVIVHGLVSLSHDCGRVVISRRDACIMVARVLLEVLSSWFFNLALMNLSMANAVAIVQALPLAVMLGAAVLGEPIGLSGWLLALLGFAGMPCPAHYGAPTPTTCTTRH